MSGLKKTVREYLAEIPDPVIREQALKNLYKEYGQEWSTDIPAALSRAFWWHRSPQGYKYWHNIHAQMVGNDPLP